MTGATTPPPAETPQPTAASGHCRDCGRAHRLATGGARGHARALMRDFERHRRLDLWTRPAEADPALSFDRLFPGDPGNMFGVLECRDADGATVVLRAFSSLPRGIRDVPGWVPPLLDAQTYHGLIVPEQRAIEAMTDEIAHRMGAGDERGAAGLRERRAERSRALFDAMCARYRLTNFRGTTRPLREVFPRGAMPGGVGECCAPKLLVHAARRGLRPVGLAEFYWGGTKGSRTLRHGEFYPPCESRCEPILGFLLCGVEDGHPPGGTHVD